MKTILALFLLGFSLAQYPNHYQEDRIHGYLFDYHSYADLLVITNDTACILVDLTGSSTAMQDLHKRYSIEDKIYVQMKNGEGERKSSIEEVHSEFHDIRVVFECFSHDVFQLTYAGH